ncbi:hypothetical protein Tco_0940300 [Tanacetum coccineum]|uniref:Reverse transcriptase domain-containing protein n=1 Tax=Tanacetum coccineum TaxID=301880 RepID=A0ABQ5DN81_9ASTR
MSDSKDSTVTYTAASSPFEGLSNIGSPGVDGPPMMPEDPYAYVVAAFQAPPSLDYVPGLEEPEQAPLLPEFVPEPVYPKFMPLEDEVFPLEDPEEDPADYPANGRDNDDNDDETSDDDTDDDDDVEEDEEEEKEEHPASADSVPPPVHRVTARMSIQEQPPTPFWYEAEIARLLAIPSPPHYTLPYWSSPHTKIPLPLLPVSSQLLEGVSEVTLPPQKRLYIAIGLRYDVGESLSAPTTRPTRGFKVDNVLLPTLDDEIRRDPERDVVYGITNTWDEMLVGMTRAPSTDETELGRREAILSREAWGRSMDASDTARSEVRALRTTVLAQQTEITALRAADRAPQAQLMETLRLMEYMQNTIESTAGMQGPLMLFRPTKVITGVADALAARDAKRSQNGKDSHDSGTGVRRQAPPAREYTYPDFMKCKPLYFKGTEGVIELTQWFERMETVFRISNYFVENQIKFATCTLLRSALTWWNSHVKTIGHDVAHAIT